MQIENLQQSFVHRLPALERRARSYFYDLDSDAREEAVQNTTSLAWKYWRRLNEVRRPDEGLLKSVWFFAMKQTRVGRTITGGSGRRGRSRLDVYDRDDLVVEHPPFFNCLSDATPIPDAVAFRLDIPMFLATLTERQRALALDLGAGMTTKDAAEWHNVTWSAISHFRKQFKMKLDRFYGAD